jgi:hypothetical protein
MLFMRSIYYHVECHWAQCRSDCHYAQCRAECRYDECRDAVVPTVFPFMAILLNV